MPRGTKRKGEDARAIQVPDAQAFADDFCLRRNLIPPNLIGSSEVEKMCISVAEEARQKYKDHRDDEIDRNRENEDDDEHGPHAKKSRPNFALDEAGLTPSQKYARRLFNNRKSAAASRVFQEVLRRQQAHVLHVGSPYVASTYNQMKDPMLKKLQEENQSLRAQIELLTSVLHNERRKTEQLRAEKTRGKQMESQKYHDLNELRMLYANLADERHPVSLVPVDHGIAGATQEKIVGPHHSPLNMSSQELEMVNHHMDTTGHNGNQTQQSCEFSQPSISGSVFLNDSQPSAHTQSENQLQPETNSQQPGSRTNSRLVTQKWPNSIGLSQIANETDAKDFTTGLTCTQSQNEDEKDLMSSSLPISSGVSIGLLAGSQMGSQPSQPLLLATKPTLGLEPSSLGDSQFFLASQGSHGNHN